MSDIMEDYRIEKIIQLCQEVQKLCAEISFAEADFCADIAGSATGTATSENESVEAWIIEAARELAMDSAHILAIAGIIKRHAPKPNDKLSDPAQKT